MVKPEEPHENSEDEPNTPGVSWRENSVIDFAEGGSGIGRASFKSFSTTSDERSRRLA